MSYKDKGRWYKIVIQWIAVSIAMFTAMHAEPIKMMFLGDSITAGSGSLPQNPDKNTSTYNDATIPFGDQIAYRGELWKLLKQKGYRVDVESNVSRDIDFVGSQTKNLSTFGEDNPGFDEDHEGHGGYTSKQIRDNIASWLESNPADIVLLHIGTNDPGKGIPIAEDNASDQDANTTVNNVKKILNTIFEKNPQTKVFVARIIEARRAHGNSGGIVSDSNPQGYWNTEDLNNAVETMVKNHPKSENIIMVDLEKGAGLTYNPCGTKLGDMQPFHIVENNETNETTYLYDYHPNINGYEKIAKKWFGALVDSKYLPDITPPVIVLNGSNPQYLELNGSYSELGARVSDDYDENLTVEINASRVDINKEGNYTVTYNATDSAGNRAIEVNRTIVVRSQVSKDANGNGIPDSQEEEWFSYDKQNQSAKVGPHLESELRVDDSIDVTSIEVADKSISIKHNNAYIKAAETAEVTTGFIEGNINKTTLKSNTSYAPGTSSVITKENDTIMIETTTTLKNNQSITMGDQ